MSEKVTIVDVRTPEEFMGGNVAGSVNIPLDQVVARIEEFKKMPKPLVLCCASGGRSGQASDYLNQNGIECENGGGWLQVNAKFGS
ncbi:MAG: phage shock protein E [Flavobacteriales bacterium]|jgi:phage shock protein E